MGGQSADFICYLYLYPFLFAALHPSIETYPIGAVRSVPRSVGWASSGVAFRCVGVDTAGLGKHTRHPSARAGLTSHVHMIPHSVTHNLVRP